MSSRQVSHQTFETFAMGSNAMQLVSQLYAEMSRALISSKIRRREGGRENTFLVILLYVFLRLTNPTPEKSTVGSRCVLIKLQSENKKQTVYDYTWPTCKRMSGSQVMGNCVGRVFFLKGGWCVQQQLHHHAVE
jgi:hypothetical protein